MQEAHFGLNETFNSNLTSASGSNNLDIHMEKNTEYGAIAILSASSYGNPNKIAVGGTTTGNETGIVIKSNEVVAWDYEGINIFGNVNGKYVNMYTSGVAKVGDATIETAGWHGSYTNGNSLITNSSFAYIRNDEYHNGIFSYDTRQIAYATSFCPSRAIMVVGEGI